jgi:N-acetylglutamate synthase-like GNAT family acetyltransferase
MNSRVQNIKITKTKDYSIFNKLAKKTGLEVADSRNFSNGWIAIHKEVCIGGISLKTDGKKYFLDMIAVDKKFQKSGVGKRLMFFLLEYLKKRKVRELYVDTKVPKFFRKFCFKRIPRSKSPKFSDCWNCPKYGRSCFPVHMMLELKRVKFN